MRIRLILVLILIVGLGVYFRGEVVQVYQDVLGGFSSLEKFSGAEIKAALDEIIKETMEPEPLRSVKDAVDANLNKDIAISVTNERRIKNGLFILNESEKLNQMARVKLADMFNRQYFEHVSPLGVGVKDLAENIGYEYILVGENLALGNFKNEQVLLDAWMASPGHRENILNKRFTEIGIAVGRGFFEGREVWLAVQEFGLPLSACEAPDDNFLVSIGELEIQITRFGGVLDVQREELKEKEGTPAYNGLVAGYNELVEKYNESVKRIRELVDEYNRQVRNFNNCAKGA